ncbi:hypothetical protein HCU64_06695 [Methylobacterium sp. C25]|uniref:hypothetical protein n=1 Tax=Methylobacterium sp. C25 TaxID=2721622 RepID=UPI001F212BEB|nr:hypothetical protein [Methylobacterium sp. C25]MCE4223434.1 hypothetical protein [Methylobacterium sp. C25]
MRASEPHSITRGAITVGITIWVAAVVLTVIVANEKAQRGELITLTREIGR